MLPASAPSVAELLVLPLAALLLYDAWFFVVHMAMHRWRWLFVHVHAAHHDHGRRVNWDVTNRLTLAERLFFVLSSNEILKLLRAHPLTRNAYVLLYIALLTDTHSGYDLPVWCHTVSAETPV